MVGKSVLDAAKAFLCWDSGLRLSVQLVALQGPVSYFYPPAGDRGSIVVFYPADTEDFSRTLFLLFHEAGHALQWERAGEVQAGHFQTAAGTTVGTHRQAFEREAWDLGRGLLGDFLDRAGLGRDLRAAYDHCAAGCLESYAE